LELNGLTLAASTLRFTTAQIGPSSLESEALQHPLTPDRSSL